MGRAALPLVLLAAILGTTAVSTLGAQAPEADVPPVLVVPDLEVSGLTRTQMLETVDCLVEALRLTGAFADVVRADDGGAPYLLRGSLSLDGNLRVLRVSLLERTSGGVLMSWQKTYARRAQLMSDCAAVARAVAASLPAPRRPDTPHQPPPEVELDAYVRLGQAGVSRTATVSGGSYVYTELSVEMDRVVGLSLRYTTGLLPAPFVDHLVDARLRMNVPVGDQVYLGLGLAWMLSTALGQPPVHWIGFRLCPVYSGDLDGFSVELLPVTLFLDPLSGEVLVSVELVSFGVRVLRLD